MQQLLFAYGTLLTGALEPAVQQLLLRHCAPGPPARLPGQLLDLGAYPGAIKGGSGWIHGRLIALRRPERCWPLLDDYEGYDAAHPEQSLYLREPTTALGSRDERWECWIYWLRRPPRTAVAIPGGDWVAYCAQPPNRR